MPANYVQVQGGGDADWSNLLSQTQSQAAREHEVAKRMAAQRALLQQMANRGEINVPSGQVSVGRGGMEFATPEARAAWEQSQAPERRDLTKRDGVNSTTADVIATAPELIKATDVAGIHDKLNPNYQESSDLALIQQRATVQQTLDQQADPNATWARGAGTGMTQPNPKPNMDAATSALGTIMGMNRQPPATGVQTPLAPTNSDPGTQGGSTQQAVPPSYNEKAKVATGNKEARAGRDAVKVNATPVNFDLEADPMIKTRSEKMGYNMVDEVQETLPSLRKAAAIEAISAMFGGTNVQGTGRFDALAAQREKDLANVNQQLAQNAVVEGITGGKVKAKTSGGNIGMDVSGFGSSASQVNVNTNVSSGNLTSKTGPAAEKTMQKQIQDANGQDTSLSFTESGKLFQDADNLPIYISGTKQINRGRSLANEMGLKIKDHPNYKSWTVADDAPSVKEDPKIITMTRPDGKRIVLMHDTGVKASKGLAGWKASADEGITQAELQQILGVTVNKGSTDTQNLGKPGSNG